MSKETIIHSMYWVRKDTLYHIIQKLKHRRFRRLLPREQRFFFCCCLFVCFFLQSPSDGLPPVACVLLVATRTTSQVLWYNSPKGKRGTTYNGWPAKASVFPHYVAAGDVSRGGTSTTQRQKFHDRAI